VTCVTLQNHVINVYILHSDHKNFLTGTVEPSSSSEFGELSTNGILSSEPGTSNDAAVTDGQSENTASQKMPSITAEISYG